MNISQTLIIILFRIPLFQKNVRTLERLQKKVVKRIKPSRTTVEEESIDDLWPFSLVRKG